MNERERELAAKRIHAVSKRLEESASRYVLVKRFCLADRSALKLMIDRGEAEIFESPTGRAYRLVEKWERER